MQRQRRLATATATGMDPCPTGMDARPTGASPPRAPDAEQLDQKTFTRRANAHREGKPRTPAPVNEIWSIGVLEALE